MARFKGDLYQIPKSITVPSSLSSLSISISFFSSSLSLDFDDIKGYVSKKLTYYMLPRYHDHDHHHHHHHHSYYYYRFTCQLDVFPKTPSGKLDKKEFPDPEGWTEVAITILDDDNYKGGNSNGITTVSSIVLQIIERINGGKLSASSSFASIGIYYFKRLYHTK